MGFIADLFVRVGADTTGLKKGLKEGKAEVTGFGAQLNKTVKSLTGFDLKTISVGAAVWKLAQFMSESIKVASDLAETTSKVGVVFGDQAQAILNFGEDTARSLGMSQNAALAAAATYGNLFRAMGMTEKTSADMSTSLVELAADLASFNNMDPTLVLDKLRAGLSGEVEPLRSLGVNLNEVIIKQKAMELGLYSGTGAITAASKAQASYALIMEQTSLAQGDFARTASGLANSQRILIAQWEDLKADAGEVGLPLAADFTNLLVNAMDGYKRLAYAINEVNEAKEKGIITDTGQANALFQSAYAAYAVIEATERATESAGEYKDMNEQLRSAVSGGTDALTEQITAAYFAGETMTQLAKYYQDAGFTASESTSLVSGLVDQIARVKSKEVTITTYLKTVDFSLSTSQNDARRGRGTTGGAMTLADYYNQGGSASGADFIVPPGFPGDSFPMRVQSGERVKVTPAGQTSTSGESDGWQQVAAAISSLPRMIRDAMQGASV